MRASADQGLRPERVAEIIVSLPDGGGRRGTGYRVSADLILTAAHVVDSGVRIRARFQADRPEEWSAEATVTWRHRGIDIAILSIGAATPGEDVTPVFLGRIDELDAVLTCTTLGFPRFKLRADEAGSRFRDAEHVRATCAVLSNRREGTLDLTVASPPPDDPDLQGSPWEGMSGAPVFSNGRLIGVVSRHHRGDGPGRLAASRVDHWADDLDVAERTALEHLLGRELRYSALPAAAPVDGAELVQEIYRAQLADIAPEQLQDRRTELHDLVSFCAGPEPYLWLQAPPWAGKTALAAWFALHPPLGVVPVWFFITARYASQSDSAAYTEAVIDQLAAIVGREPKRNASATARDGERRLLLREAAERVAERGGTLVLVVDGLDEDRGGATSIASLLPERPPSNVRVLVTSRTSPGIPADVGGAHPLRHCRVENLSAAPAARHTEYEAKYDLQQALSGDRLQRDLVGLLTAARGTLTIDDLRELTEEPIYELRQRLGSAFGRILRLRGGLHTGGFESSHGLDGYGYGGHSGGDVTLYVSGRGYLFAHETLLTAAQDELGPDVDAYMDRLHAWARSYERRGWPENTPLYLLQPYGRLLAFVGDTRRVTALATDVRRSDRLRAATGSDAAGLAEIGAARENVRRVTPDDLGALAALAVAEDFVARRNESLHPDIPVVYARLGRTRQAIGLARSVFRPMDRAWALARVARVLAEAGDRRGVGLAEEALGLTETALAEAPWLYDDSHRLVALGRVATVLALVGSEAESMRRLSELPLPGYDVGAKALVEACVETATVLRDRSFAANLLRRAEVCAGEIRFLPERVRMVAVVAEAWQQIGDRRRAEDLYDSVAELARSHADDRVDVPGAAEVLHRLLHDPTSPINWDEGYRAVSALVATGRVDDAQLLVEALQEKVEPDDPGYWAGVWPTIAEGRAREGRAEDAWAALEVFWEYDESFGEDDRSAADLAGLLAEAGAADRLESLLSDSKERWPWKVAQALAALALHFADRDQERCLRLLDRAERVENTGGRAAYSAQHERIAVVAAALARAGCPDEAGQLLETIGTPDVRAWGYAAASVATARKDILQALDWAECASEVTRVSDHRRVRANTSAVIIQALAGAGAAQRSAEAIGQLSEEVVAGRALEDSLGLARAVTAEGMWSHDPEFAEELVDDFLRNGRRSVPMAAHFLAATTPYDSARSRMLTERLLAVAGDAKRATHEVEALQCLVGATMDLGALGDLEHLRHQWADDVYSPPNTVLALVCAALGDPEAALATALGRTTEEERSESLAYLAAYAAGVPDGTPVARPVGDPRGYLRTALHLATSLFPPAGGSDLPRARRLLADALTRAGWRHAVPVLASIDPKAILPLRDIVFAHTGLGE
ncbi:trypsin-like peptidase domain-containing protein [Streptomyces diastatochromogenes]|uniref:trypsin-like peptidase domain-containing protein n=1 Tax=Streptomyces diastatochromogenes TaxID=42236 RepID=UPI0036A42AA8